MFTVALAGQRPASPSSGTAAGSTGNPGTGTTGTRGTFGNNPSRSNNGTSGDGYDVQRPIFLSGSVIFDDGAPTNNEVRIERICNGSAHLEAHTETRGPFSFQVGGQTGLGIGTLGCLVTGWILLLFGVLIPVLVSPLAAWVV